MIALQLTLLSLIILLLLVQNRMNAIQNKINKLTREDLEQIKMVITNNNGFTEEEKKQLNK